MKTLISLLLGVVLGAAAFHAYYLTLDPARRCGWDHPLNDQARLGCQSKEIFKGYAKGARKELDNLIGDINR